MVKQEAIAYRSIIHVDMDAFYASIEQLDDSSLRGKPVIVGGAGPRGVVATASYEARPFGVHSAMPMAQAVKLCPQATVLPSRISRYKEFSDHIFDIFRSFTPLVETLSLDEAFLDVSASEKLFGSGMDIARAVKQKIFRETRLTASAGIAPNKFVAKIASDIRKPDGLYAVEPEGLISFLHPLPVAKLWGVGKITSKTFESRGITTIGDLSKLPRTVLVNTWGKLGARLYDLSRGIDDRTVAPDSERKSLGSERTFAEDIHTVDMLTPILLSQSQEVARRLRKQSLSASTITIKIKFARRHANGTYPLITRSNTIPSPTNDAAHIYRVAARLLKNAPNISEGVRLIGIHTSGFSQTSATAQLDLFLPPSSNREEKTKLGQAIDTLSEKYGDRIITLGSPSTE